MAAPVELEEHQNLEQIREFAHIFQGRAGVRWMAILLIKNGMSGREAARQLGMSSGWVSGVVRRYNELGPKGLSESKNYKPIRATKLTPVAATGLKKQLRAWLKASQFTRITAKRVVAHLEDHYAIFVHPSTARRYVHKLGYGHLLPTRTKRK